LSDEAVLLEEAARDDSPEDRCLTEAHKALLATNSYAFVTKQGGALAATATLCVDDDVGYLASAVTLPAFRRRSARLKFLGWRLLSGSG
jgi:hypothetical protein